MSTKCEMKSPEAPIATYAESTMNDDRQHQAGARGGDPADAKVCTQVIIDSTVP